MESVKRENQREGKDYMGNTALKDAMKAVLASRIDLAAVDRDAVVRAGKRSPRAGAEIRL